MSFESRYSVVVSSPLQHVWESLSSKDKFKEFMHLSPSCHTVEILSTDQVVVRLASGVSNSSLNEVAINRPSYDTISDTHCSNPSSVCLRIRFKMVERVPILFGLIKNDVTISGTQIMSPSLGLHIYESDANKGLVTIYKLRRFTAKGQQETLIEELICGKTKNLLQRYTQTACRNAHQKHMQGYQSFIQQQAVPEAFP